MKSKLDYVRDWLRKASSDLKIATREISAEEFYLPMLDEMRETAQMARDAWDFVLVKLAEEGARPLEDA